MPALTGLAAATLISGLFSGGMSALAGGLTNRATRRQNEQMYDLAMLNRSDQLAESRANRSIARRQMRESSRQFDKNYDLARDQFEFGREQAAEAKEERADDRLYNRTQNTLDRWMSMVNNDANMRFAVQNSLKRVR